MNPTDKIFVAGHKGMVGNAIVRLLQKEGYHNLILRSSSELDLRNQQFVSDFFAKELPKYVFFCAGKVGGIHANNTYRAEFIYDNVIMSANVIHSAYETGVKKLLFLGSSCIYPKMSPQPIRENYLLTGPFEPTNEPYAVAKVTGVKMCEAYKDQYGCNFISCMPTNLYGPNDNYDLYHSHVLPALLRKIHDAKRFGENKVELWGTGKAIREFLYVEDLAEAVVFLMKTYNESQIINIGSNEEVSIRNLANIIKEVVGFEGELYFDASKPDGTPRKLLDSSLIFGLGWKPNVSLKHGIEQTYEAFLNGLGRNINASV